MAIVVDSAPRQQRPQERESILELLGRGLAEGAGKSFGTGLGNLATQGLGMLMDPNMRPLDMQALSLLGLDPAQAQSVAAIKNPAVQRDIILSQQQRQADMQDKLAKQARTQQFSNLINKITPGGTQEAAESQAVTAEEIDGLELQDVKDAIKYAQKERGMSQQQELGAYKAVQPYIKETRDTARAEKLNKARYNKILALDATGKVDDPLAIKALKTVGLDWLMSPETQELQKLSTDFAIDFPKYTGGRVTNSEMALLMQRVPNLMQSKEGRARVIGNLQKFADLKIKEEEILSELLKKQGGKRTLDLEDRVAERMAPEYEKFATKFVEDLKSAAPASSSQKNSQFVGGLPNAAAHKGVKVKNKATGQIMVSDGTKWIPETQMSPTAQPTAAPATARKVANNPFQIGEVDYGEY